VDGRDKPWLLLTIPALGDYVLDAGLCSTSAQVTSLAARTSNRGAMRAAGVPNRLTQGLSLSREARP